MKINGNIRRGVWVLAIVFLAGLDAAACTYELPWPKRTLKQQVNLARKDSRAVFSGSVLKIDEAGYTLKVTLRVDNSWKGLLPTEVVLFTGRGGGDCGYRFQVGHNYLIYAYGQDLDHLGTNICQRTVPFSDAGSDLKILGRPLRRNRARSGWTKPNKSLDRSAGSVFLNLID